MADAPTDETNDQPISLGYVIFYVADVAAVVDFYVRAFGFTCRMLTPENDYGELSTGATTLAFVADELAAWNLDAAGGYQRLEPNGRPVGASITLLSSDVPAALAAAEAAGGRVYTQPTVKPWGQTVAYLIDPGGALIELATPMST